MLIYWFSSWIRPYQASRNGWHGVLSKGLLFDKELEMDKLVKEIDFVLNADDDVAAEMQHVTIERNENFQSKYFWQVVSKITPVRNILLASA